MVPLAESKETSPFAMGVYFAAFAGYLCVRPTPFSRSSWRIDVLQSPLYLRPCPGASVKFCSRGSGQPHRQPLAGQPTMAAIAHGTARRVMAEVAPGGAAHLLALAEGAW